MALFHPHRPWDSFVGNRRGGTFRSSNGVRLSRCSTGIQMKRKDAAEAHWVPSKVMTVHEVSAYLHVHQSTVYRLLKRNQIPAFRMGSGWRFNIEAIDHWLLQQGKPGG
jgi:excisionase family DNA binding protein